VGIGFLLLLLRWDTCFFKKKKNWRQVAYSDKWPALFDPSDEMVLWQNGSQSTLKDKEMPSSLNYSQEEKFIDTKITFIFVYEM